METNSDGAKVKRRKRAADRKERGILIWVTEELGAAIDAEAEIDMIPTSTWARNELTKLVNARRAARASADGGVHG